MHFEQLIADLRELEEHARDCGLGAAALEIEKFRIAMNRNRGAFDPTYTPAADDKARIPR